MLNFFLSLVSELKLFVGFVKNGNFASPLDKDDEEYWINELETSNRELARTKLIEHNLRLVAHIVKKYENVNELFDDLVSIGTIGLIKAVNSYSPEKGVKLATYSAKCIENEILMHIRNLKKNSKDISLFESIGQDKDGSSITFIDVIPSEEKSIEEELNNDNMIKTLANYLHILEPKELEILELRYGLNGNKEFTQKEVAKKFNISRSYVSRIEKRAFTKLVFEFKKQKIIE